MQLLAKVFEHLYRSRSCFWNFNLSLLFFIRVKDRLERKPVFVKIKWSRVSRSIRCKEAAIKFTLCAPWEKGTDIKEIKQLKVC